MAELNVNILSPAKVISRVKAGHIKLPGSVGEMGILPGHAALVAELGIGELAVKTGDRDEQPYFVAGGYVEVENDQVKVLVDAAEKPEQIDRDRAAKARDRAAERLASADESVDVQRAQAAHRRATERLAIATRYAR